MKAILTIEKLEELAKAIPDNWALCEFLGMTEAEVLVAQTVQAAAANAKKRGIQCSFRGPGVFGRGGTYDNGKGYRKLVDEGLFVEETMPSREFQPLPKGIVPDANGNVILIWMTDKLIGMLDEHLAKVRR